MSVRAKFEVAERIEVKGGGGTVKLSPVTSGSEENKQFYLYTPGGSISLSTVNPKVMAELVPGKQFYVDFTEAGE
jgi:hypothetical protein